MNPGSRWKGSRRDGRSCTLPSTGIAYFIVNGTIVVKDSRVVKGVFPGQPIRASM
jgi:hypothetical protein